MKTEFDHLLRHGRGRGGAGVGWEEAKLRVRCQRSECRADRSHVTPVQLMVSSSTFCVKGLEEGIAFVCRLTEFCSGG